MPPIMRRAERNRSKTLTRQRLAMGKKRHSVLHDFGKTSKRLTRGRGTAGVSLGESGSTGSRKFEALEKYLRKPGFGGKKWIQSKKHIRIKKSNKQTKHRLPARNISHRGARWPGLATIELQLRQDSGLPSDFPRDQAPKYREFTNSALHQENQQGSKHGGQNLQRTSQLGLVLGDPKIRGFPVRFPLTRTQTGYPPKRHAH